MSHNVSPIHEEPTFERYTELQGSILTLAGRYGREQKRQLRLLRNMSDRLVVSPWEDGRTITLDGEDLYALRAWLAEFPPSAFTEPAPSVVTPDWADGDYIDYTDEDSALAYARVGGQWYAVGEDADAEWRGNDAEMDRLVRSLAVTVVRKNGQAL